VASDATPGVPGLGARVTDAPLWSMGFRPFYLLAALFAAIAVPVWLAAYHGHVGLDVTWHAREMLFGFAPAVLAGFLFTAVRNWTGLPTPAGAVLVGLAALWLLARLLLFGGLAVPGAVADALFLPAVGLAIAVPLFRSGNRRNYKVLAIVAALALLDLAAHLARLGVLPAAAQRAAVLGALDLFAILMAVMAGRVIPAFIGNAIPGARLRRVPVVEWLAFGTLVILFVAGLLRPWLALPAAFRVGFAAACAVAHAVRLAFWYPWQTRGNALLWMLPAAYAWIPFAFALRACAEAGVIAPVLATHALTIGAMGSLMLAMMMRSALGHTGRPLVAGPWELTAYLLVQAAALVRVFGGMAWQPGYSATLTAAGVLWSAAFGVFLCRFLPLLSRPRPQ
jgi:uncharacterized protein involved in response to NO